MSGESIMNSDQGVSMRPGFRRDRNAVSYMRQPRLETATPALAQLLRDTTMVHLETFMLQDEVQDIVKEWEKSLPHNEFFFPGVPRFNSNELRQELGHATAGRSRKIAKGDGGVDFPPPPSSSTSSAPITKWTRPFEHDCLLQRDLLMGCNAEGGVTSASQSIVKGETFQLDDFLVPDGEGDDLVRRDGTAVQAVSLRGKHVLLCCFHVPLYWASDAVPYARSISSLCEELATTKSRNECEIVIVAKMAPHWAESEVAFRHFCDAFPPSCLTVNFRCKKLVDRIFQSVNRQSVYPRALLVGPDGKVLSRGGDRFFRFGVKDGFPFSNERLRAVQERDNRLLSGTSTRPLATLLGGLDPLPSDYRLRDVRGVERISISRLEKKDVAVYLCCNGELFSRLSEAYYKFNKKRPGFEVVVVWFPDGTGLGKCEFKHLMTSAFELRSLPWLDFPFDNSVARRLVRISGDKLDDTMSDRLVIVGAGGKYVDPIADVIMELWDIDYAYPFSFTGLVDKEVGRLGAVTLNSILDKMENVVRLEKGKQKPISKKKLKTELKKKRVFLYHTAVEMPRDGTQFGQDDDPWQQLKQIKDAYPGCEVLYVQSCEMEYDSQDFPNDLSMYMCPFDLSLYEHLYTLASVALSSPVESLGFGEDGHVASLGAIHDPFAKSLRRDICFRLATDISCEQKNHIYARLSRIGRLMCSACLR